MLCACLCICLFAGCRESSNQVTEEVQLAPDAIWMYTVDSVNLNLVKNEYVINNDFSVNKKVAGILYYMTREYKDEQGYTLNSAMKIINNEYDERYHIVNLRVNVANELEDEYVEMLWKAAITKTLCQIEGVDEVKFECYDSSQPGVGVVLEFFDETSFVDAETEGGYLQKDTITIYFANEQGDKLIEYNKMVEITTDVSLEQVVIESLIAGPQREGYGATIPEGTTLKRISIKDGVCYVDLSGEFNQAQTECVDMVTLYSVVNSLCELPTVNKVQFLINGEKQALFREVIPFDGMLERNMDLVEVVELEE